MKRTDTPTLAGAMDILARDIQSRDGIANAAIAEAAERLRELDFVNAKIRKALTTSRAQLLMCRDHFADDDGMTSWAAACIKEVVKADAALKP